MTSHYSCDVARRDVLRVGLYAGGLAALGVPMSLSGIARAAEAAASGRILVVVELSGANDGLNTVVPYRDDAYYRARPRLGIRADKLRKIDDTSASNRPWPASSGSTRTASWRSCTASATTNPRSPISPPWRTGTPGRPTAATLTAGSAASPTAWIRPAPPTISSTSTPTSRSRCARAATCRWSSTIRTNSLRTAAFEEESALRGRRRTREVGNPTQRFLFEVANSAQNAEPRVRQACAEYRTPVDYGLVHFGLERVAALIAAGFPTRIYYVAFRNNAFDTHV